MTVQGSPEVTPAVEPGTGEPASGSASAGAALPPRTSRWLAALGLGRQYGVFGVFVAMVIVFAVLRPGRFATTQNFETMIANSAALTLAAIALTFVLSLGQFDLSFAAVIGLAGAIAVYAMSFWGWATVPAILAALVVGAVVGLANGLMVGYGRVPALIGTLAVSSAATGIEVSIMKQNTVYEGVRPAYVNLTTSKLFGVSTSVYLTILVVLLMWVLLRYTVLGRRVRAIGSGEEAARLAGVRTRVVIALGFVVTGVIAGLAGVVVTSQGSSYYPDSGTPYLLPAFAAAFLGFSAIGGRRFSPVATFFGVIFTQVLATGLTMLNAPPWATNLSSGVVLAVAVLLVRKQTSR